ncbi:glycosyltransferase involved in cell wall biosynthesis [Pseudomonas sp. BS3782 TE3695]|uniref:glycosyltransferase n=1 Tax=Pseudomonas sp. BS3782 TE3695 TaxID=3349323 RepID=UPI003D219589
MKIYLVRDGVFTTTNGRPASNLLHYEFYGRRYLSVFSEVIIVGRLFEKQDPTALPVDGPNVSFLKLPAGHGPIGLIKSLPSILKTVLSTTSPGSAYLLRVPANVPSIYALVLWLKRIPFCIEVCADPFDSYSAKALNNHPLSRLFQKFFVGLVKWQCRKAVATAYVTRNALQLRYPPGEPATSYAFTSIDLFEEAYALNAKRIEDFETSTPHIVLTGNMQGKMKGHDTLLNALAIIHKKGIKAKLTIIGYGNNEPLYRKMCADLNLENFVTFTGKMASGEPIRRILDTADLFVLPSRQEGLPRALLEAMARALPAIATRVGGTPELVEECALVPPDDEQLLANKIIEFLSSPDLLHSQSSRNLLVARTYNAAVIQNLRNDFLTSMMKLSRATA